MCGCVCLDADVFRDDVGVPYKLYGDSIYSTTTFVCAPPKGGNVLPAQKEFNRKMSSLRVSVEWLIGKVYWLCGLLRQRVMHEVFRDDVASRFLVGVFLTNCHTCLYGSQASMYFKCESPDLEEYTDMLFLVPGDVVAV